MGHVDADVDHLFPEKALYERPFLRTTTSVIFRPPGTSRLGKTCGLGRCCSPRGGERMQADDYMPYLNELIWREFYMQVLYHNPHVVDHAFREKYDAFNGRTTKRILRPPGNNL